MNTHASLKWTAGFAIFGVLIACALPATASTTPKPRHLAPPVACTSTNRMDVFIDEDNIMWECTCEMLKTGNICRWQVIGGVDPVTARKHRKHHLAPRRPIAYTIPPVTA